MADKTTKIIEIEVELEGGEKVTKQFEKLSDGTLKAADSAQKLDAKFEDVYKGIEPLTTRMGEAEDRLYELALAGDTTSKEYQELLNSVGQYRKVQIQTDLAVDSAATTLGQKLGGALTGATSGFAAVQGVMGLVGSESEQLEKALLKVQSALAIQQGVQGIKEAIPSFKMLGKTAMTALKGIRTGIAATGIGVLLVAVGTLVAYWDDIKEAVSGVSEEQKKLTKESEKNVIAAQEKTEQLNLQENALRLQGKSEREILKLKIAATDEIIKQLEIDIKRNKIALFGQIEAAERAKQISKTLIKVFLNSIALITRLAAAPIDAIIVSLNAASDFLGITEKRIPTINGMLTNLIDKGAEAASKFVFDPAQVAKDGKAAIEEQEKTLQGLRSNRDGFLLQIKAIDEAEVASNKAKNDKILEQERERLQNIKNLKNEFLDEVAAIEEENFERTLTEQQKEERAVEEKYFRLIELAKQNGLDTNEIEIGRLNELNDIRLKFGEEAYLAQKDLDDKADEDAKKRREQNFEFAQQGMDAIQQLGDLVFANKMSKLEKGSKAEEELAKKQFKFNKALQLGGAIIDAGKAITASLAQAPIAIGPVPNPAGIASLAFAATSSALNIAKIASTKFESPGGAPSNPSPGGIGGGDPQAPQFNVVGDSGVNQLAQLQQQPTQAFVVSGEVTTAQALDRNRVQNATL